MVRSHTPILESNIRLDIGNHVLSDPCIVQEVLIFFSFFFTSRIWDSVRNSIVRIEIESNNIKSRERADEKYHLIEILFFHPTY
jgi:hypothetical protein